MVLGTGRAVISATYQGETASVPVAQVVAFLLVTCPASFAALGETGACTASATWTNGVTQDVTGRAVWSGMNDRVVSVAPDGTVIAQGLGVADICATYSNVARCASVFVNGVR